MTQEKKALKPIEEFDQTIKRMETQFKNALPPHISPEKFIRATLTAIQLNPEILNSDRRVLFLEIMKAAQDGLLIDGREAAIVVFNTKNGPMAKYLPMTGGILKKVRNSGELLSLTVQIVHENDAFDFWIDDLGEHVQHKPVLTGDRGEPKLTYAIAKTKDGGSYFEIMNEDEMAAVRNASRSKEKGPWSGDFASEMRKKTVIRRLAKRLPMSTDLDQALRRDDEIFDFNAKKELPSNPPQIKQSRLSTLLEAPNVASVALETPFDQEILPDKT